MTLSLLNNFERELNRPFFRPVWFKEIEGYESEHFPISSQLKYDDESTSWRLTAEIAGVEKEQLKLDMKEDHLVVSGKKTKGLNLGQFEKAFQLPEGIDAEKIEAQFEDGVLTVMLPLESKRAPKAIQIK